MESSPLLVAVCLSVGVHAAGWMLSGTSAPVTRWSQSTESTRALSVSLSAPSEASRRRASGSRIVTLSDDGEQQAKETSLNDGTGQELRDQTGAESPSRNEVANDREHTPKSLVSPSLKPHREKSEPDKSRQSVKVVGSSMRSHSTQSPSRSNRKPANDPSDAVGSLASSGVVVPGAQSPIVLQGIPTPEYPKRARRLGHEGVVRVKVQVEKTGQVNDMAVIKSSGYEQLDASALKAVGQARFSPATLLGQPVASEKVLRFTFTLDGVTLER